MARKRRKQHMQAGELNLTAMIDIGFQLLNFFVITTRPVDVFANLDIFRPQAQAESPAAEAPPQLLEIVVYQGGYTLQKTNVDLREVDRQLTKIAASSKAVPVIIKCTEDSSHAALVSILDLCAKTGLSKISVFSM
jgi:biopolymer transport protein ExbD